MSYTPLFPPIGQPFTVLPTVDSTNNYAMAQAQKGLASHGSVFMALEQTQGKGQRGKTWLAEPGENIMLSVVLQPKPMTIGNPFILSASVALGCADLFSAYAGADEVRIKWPNDLYWQDRKAGGVLIESGMVSRELGTGVGSPESGVGSPESGVADIRSRNQQQEVFVIAGIGININQTSFNNVSGRPVSLKQITGKDWDIIVLAKELCQRLELRFAAIANDKTDSVHEEYNNLLFKRGETVRLKKNNAVFETMIRGVSPQGRLQTTDSFDREFDSGEVEWIL